MTQAKPTTPRRYSSDVLLVGIITTVSVTIAAILFSGIAHPTELLDPGPLVRWGQPLANGIVHLAGMLCLGGLVLCAVVLPRDNPTWQRAATISAYAAIVWTLAQAAHLVLAHAGLMGTGIGGPGYFTTLAEFLTGIEVGRTLAWAVVLSALTALLAVLNSTLTSAAWAAVVAGLALVPRAGLGHSASAGNHEVAVSAMWLHLVGIGLWAGALIVVFFATKKLGSQVAAVMTRYSTMAGWAVLLVVVSGVAGAWIRLENPAQLFTSTWGILLIVKVLAFGALAAAGWWHRRITLPLLERHGTAKSWPFWRLASVEVLIMGAMVGISATLGSTEPPVPQARISEIAEYAQLPPAWFAGLITQTRLDPLFAVLAVAGAWVYFRWVQRLRARGDAWPTGRVLSWFLAMALTLWTTSGGVGLYAQTLFSVHMLQHMLLISVIPIFVVLACPVSLAMRALPRRTDGTRGPRELFLVLLHHPWTQFLGHPVVAAIHVPLSMAVFYLTPIFEFAMRSHFLHVLAMVHFFVVGYIFTNVVIGTDPGPRRPFYPVRLVLLVPTMVFHTFFGLFLISTNAVLAGEYFMLFGATATELLEDQNVGGAVSWAMGELPAIALAVLVAAGWARHDHNTQQRKRSARSKSSAVTQAAPSVTADRKV